MSVRTEQNRRGSDGIIYTSMPMLLISHWFRLVVFGIPSLSLRVLSLFVFHFSIVANFVQSHLNLIELFEA